MKRWIAFIILFTAGPGRADGGPPPPPVDTRLERRQERACTAGDGAACVALGDRLIERYFGSNGGRRRDAERAMALFEKACGVGHVPGCREVGWVWQEGLLGRDEARAEGLYQRACDAGDGGGCALLGSMRERRSGLSAALPLYERACEGDIEGLGCISGCAELGSIYRYGREGIVADRARAAGFAEKACYAGCGFSCDEAGTVYRDGTGVEEDVRRAVALFQQGCQLRFAQSCASLSELYRTGSGVVQDAALARRLLAKACRLSHNEVELCRR